MLKRESQWDIKFNRAFFKIYLTFLNSNPQFEIIFDYGDWKLYVSVLKSIQSELPQRQKRGEVLTAITKYQALYTSQKNLSMIAKLYQNKFKSKKFVPKITDDEEKTGMKKEITIYLYDFMDKIILHFDRETFIRFKNTLINADKILEKKLKTSKGPIIYNLTP